MSERYAKNARTLDMYERLREGKSICKAEEAEHFGVDERSIQRDIDDIRAFLAERQQYGDTRQVVFDRRKKGFVMEGQEAAMMTNSEILAVTKILLESRAFSRKEMDDILHKLVNGCVPMQNMKVVCELIANEAFHYVELKHGGCAGEKLWQLGMDIKEHDILKISYQRMDALEEPVERVIEPVAILFAEYYFYLNAYIVERKANGKFERSYDYPAVFRLDRIIDVKEMGEKFSIQYNNRFEEGEFRKRVQFMYPGELMKIQFYFRGVNVEAVLDRLPIARILSQKDGEWLVEAQVYGQGMMMWLLSQGEMIEVVSPASFREKMVEKLKKMLENYE